MNMHIAYIPAEKAKHNRLFNAVMVFGLLILTSGFVAPVAGWSAVESASAIVPASDGNGTLFFETPSDGSQQARGIDTLSLKTIFAEPFLPGVRPTVTGFTADSRAFFYTASPDGNPQTKTFRTTTNRRTTTEASEDERRVTSAAISPDRTQMVFNERGTLYIAHVDGSQKRVLAAMTGISGNGVWSATGDQVAFVAGRAFWSVNVRNAQVRQLSQPAPESHQLSLRSWALGDSTLVFTRTDRAGLREVFFPEYNDKFVTPGGSLRGVAVASVEILDVTTLRTQTLVTGKLSIRGLAVSPSGRWLIADVADEFLKNRQITSYDLRNSNVPNVLHSESTEGWIHGGNNNLQFAPDSDRFTFTSEADGWNHIYLTHADGSEFQQLTSGPWEVDWNAWLNGRQLIIASTEVDPGERHIYLMDLQRNSFRSLTRDPGYRSGFRLSPDKRTLVYSTTWFNTPDDLYLLEIDRPEREHAVTQSVPERFAALGLSKPEYIRFTGRDGETRLSMELIKPYDFDPSKKYPVVVFMHGAGSLQNVYKGWSANYWREYLFHHYLARRGYVVIEVDFRHSLGYGRKFREDVTNWMGKYELEDVIDGIDLVARDGYIDTERVGVYGGSYGGFMSLYAVHHAPDRFHVAAALRAVTNWENYYYANPWYTGPRLGHPDRDAEHYLRSSPLTFADSLTRPVLMLHGLTDDNVGFQDAVQYIERLIQSGNEEFDMMMYPTERHSFVRPAAWYDEYRRIFDYFERYLKP